MYSYTTGRNYYGRLTNSSDSTHLTNGDSLINESVSNILALAPWTFLEVDEIIDTVASQRAYEIPANIRETLSDVYIDVSNNIYTPYEINSSEKWKYILGRQSGSSEVQQFWYRRSGKVEFDPIPASSGNDIHFIGRKKFGSLSAADYTTGTASVAIGAKAVTGAGGATFTAAMVGRFIKFTDGDGLLYEIASYTDATHITLTKAYEGIAAVSGSTYNIGQYSPLPDDFQAAPIYRAAAIYWMANDNARAEKYWRMYDGGQEIGLRDTLGGMMGNMYRLYGRKSEGGYIPPTDGLEERDPNMPPTTIAQSNFT